MLSSCLELEGWVNELVEEYHFPLKREGWEKIHIGCESWKKIPIFGQKFGIGSSERFMRTHEK